MKEDAGSVRMQFPINMKVWMYFIHRKTPHPQLKQNTNDRELIYNRELGPPGRKNKIGEVL